MANHDCCGGYLVAKFLLEIIFAPISGRASVTEKVDLGSIPCLALSNKKGQCDDSTVCGRQVEKTW